LQPPRSLLCFAYGAAQLRGPRLALLYSPTPRPTVLYPLSLHDALPISQGTAPDYTRALLLRNKFQALAINIPERANWNLFRNNKDRKSTRLNSSHVESSYAVFCLKKKKSSGGAPRTAASPPRWARMRSV